MGGHVAMPLLIAFVGVEGEEKRVRQVVVP